LALTSRRQSLLTATAQSRRKLVRDFIHFWTLTVRQSRRFVYPTIDFCYILAACHAGAELRPSLDFASDRRLPARQQLRRPLTAVCPISQYGADDANHPTIDSLRSRSTDRYCSGMAAGASAATPTTAGTDKVLCDQQGPRPENRRNGTQQNPKPPSLRPRRHRSRSVSAATCQRKRRPESIFAPHNVCFVTVTGLRPIAT
jgi:hypothetical protein